ncbi:MAG TPA: hypothetical protein VHD34_02770 [Xanthobacteraceae bacterium]|nr:hypothetical protein [Xanthobacteraceae bacterium]
MVTLSQRICDGKPYLPVAMRQQRAHRARNSPVLRVDSTDNTLTLRQQPVLPSRMRVRLLPRSDLSQIGDEQIQQFRDAARL